MDVLWDSVDTPRTVREVAAELPDHAYTTVLTVLDRLRRKQLVRRDTDGRAHRYSAAVRREAYTAARMHEAMGTAPDRDAVLARFAETVSPAGAGALRRVLDDQDRRVPRRSAG